jgi:oxaloacetate decarboxylase (Na+ extruding) subunit gamma
MLAEGLELMMVGMATVFAFLGLMVCAMNASGFIIRTYFPPPVEASKPARSAGTADAEIAIVLAAAHQWRQENGGN